LRKVRGEAGAHGHLGRPGCSRFAAGALLRTRSIHLACQASVFVTLGKPLLAGGLSCSTLLLFRREPGAPGRRSSRRRPLRRWCRVVRHRSEPQCIPRVVHRSPPEELLDIGCRCQESLQLDGVAVGVIGLETVALLPRAGTKLQLFGPLRGTVGGRLDPRHVPKQQTTVQSVKRRRSRLQKTQMPRRSSVCRDDRSACIGMQGVRSGVATSRRWRPIRAACVT